jgi:putative oxidoreductase
MYESSIYQRGDVMELGLLLIRLTVGLTLAAHGSQKLLGWFGGHGLAGTAGWLESVGFRPGRRHAILAGLTEIGGGVLLAIGLATPLGAAIVASVMIVAAAIVHFRNGFFLTGGGYEYNLVLGVAALALAFTGPGAISIDALFGYAEGGVVPGLAAVGIAVIGAAGQLASRRLPEAAAVAG